MERPESTDLLPGEVEEQLAHLLEQWANDNRLSSTRANSIREAAQDSDTWDQRFWSRMNTVLSHATTVAQYVPSKQWSLAIHLQTDLKWISTQKNFDDLDYRPYLRLST